METGMMYGISLGSHGAKVARTRPLHQGFTCWTNDIYPISIINARTWTCLYAMELVKMRGDSLTILHSTNLPFTIYIYVHIPRSGEYLNIPDLCLILSDI